jgi:hypothetical protein
MRMGVFNNNLGYYFIDLIENQSHQCDTIFESVTTEISH